MADPSRSTETPHEDPPYPPIGYAWYVVIVLMLIYVTSFLDRQILALLVGPIKADLKITDSQMGLLMGPAFAIMYIIAGIPIGRMVDVFSRRAIIGVGQILWSIMSAGCAFVNSFAQFFGLRVGLGIGEASLSPAAYSIVTDIFPKEKLSTAMSVYSMGIYIGSGLSLLFGGLVIDFFSKNGPWMLPGVGEVQPWQMVFLAIAAPVIPLTIMLFTVAEPYRRGLVMVRDAAGKLRSRREPLPVVKAYVMANAKTFATHNFGLGLLALSGYASAAWAPTFFIRQHGQSVGDVGKILGILTIIFGTAGIIFGGVLADWMMKRGYKDAKVRVAMFAAFLRLPSGILFTQVDSVNMAYLMYAPSVFFVSMPFGVGPAAIQEMMPPSMRGQGSAIYLFIINLLGMGLGPYILPLLQDNVFASSDQPVRESLLYVCTAAHVIAGFSLLYCLAPFRKSLEYLQNYKKLTSS